MRTVIQKQIIIRVEVLTKNKMKEALNSNSFSKETLRNMRANAAQFGVAVFGVTAFGALGSGYTKIALIVNTFTKEVLVNQIS